MTKILDEEGKPLDASYSIENGDLILHSRGGTKSKGGLNTEYGQALRLILLRIRNNDIRLASVLVDSSRTRGLSDFQRTIYFPEDDNQNADVVFTLLSRRMAKVGQRPGASSGNPTKRIRFIFRHSHTPEFLMETLGGGSDGRLPASMLNDVDEKVIWLAVEKLRGAADFGDFIESTKFDVLLENGERLPPKAMFGLAASLALGFEVKPHHFSGGQDTICFQKIRSAGFPIVTKPDARELANNHLSPDDVVWSGVE